MKISRLNYIKVDRPIIDAPGVQIQFRYVALFQNEGDTKATAVENRDEI